MEAFWLLMALFGVLSLIIYTPAIYHGIKYVLYEKEFQRLLKAMKDEDWLSRSRIVITELLGTGSEPSGKISFADAMQNAPFALNSICCLMSALEEDDVC